MRINKYISLNIIYFKCLKMKKTLLFVIIYFTFFSEENYAQNNWAPLGATWYYGIIESPAVNIAEGYLKFEVESDTTVQGKICKKINKSKVTSAGFSTDNGIELLYTDSSKLYYLYNNIFRVLYDFNAIPGQFWQIRIPCELYGLPLTADSLRLIKVDSIKQIIIGSDTLKQYYVTSYNIDSITMAYDWFFENPIIVGIGAKYMFPEYSLNEVEIPYLRCYSDSVMNYFSNPLIPCDTLVTNIFENNIENYNVELFPNPTNHFLYIVILGNSSFYYSIVITDILGNYLYRANNLNNQICINIQNWVSGIYFLRCLDQDNKNLFQRKFVIN